MNQINEILLKDFVPRFRVYLEAEVQQWREERREKDRFFEQYFSQAAIHNLEEGTIRELVHILWAFNGWTNRDYLFDEMLSSGLSVIRDAFERLLYGNEPVADRFDYVKKHVRMMGAASISEILAHHDHRTYPIWNSRSRRGLLTLGVEESLLPKSAQITGKQYAAFRELACDVRGQVAEQYPGFEDLFELDFLLYFISLQQSPSKPSVPISVEENGAEDFDHGEVIEQVLELGDGLGFEVQKEFPVVQGARIDAIWRSRVANLGTIAYAFEVHRRGSRDSAILNLQRVRRDPAIQKVIVVSSKLELEKFRGEIAYLDEGFRTSVGYLEVQELQRVLDYLQSLKDILKSLGLLTAEAFD